MPVLKLYLNGATSGSPPSVNSHKRAKRREVVGWSPKSARNQRRWFYSIELPGLTGHGMSCTLTLRDCPASSDELHAVRRAFLMRLSRLGMIRGHWLVEWQRRGVPHLHGCFYFKDPAVLLKIPAIWMELTQQWGSGRGGQHVQPIYETTGWLKYLAKHGARGVHHYQRSNENLPAGWKKTGRMWGYVGDWPIRLAMEFELDRPGYWVYRRMVRRWSVSQAREKRDGRQVAFCRRMLSCNQRPLSEVRGTSDWLPVEVSSRLVVWLGAQGYNVEQVA